MKAVHDGDHIWLFDADDADDDALIDRAMVESGAVLESIEVALVGPRLAQWVTEHGGLGEPARWDRDGCTIDLCDGDEIDEVRARWH